MQQTQLDPAASEHWQSFVSLSLDREISFKRIKEQEIQLFHMLQTMQTQEHRSLKLPGCLLKTELRHHKLQRAAEVSRDAG